MTPWWLRPTAEGANEENREQDKSPSKPSSPPEPAAPAPSAEAEILPIETAPSFLEATSDVSRDAELLPESPAEHGEETLQEGFLAAEPEPVELALEHPATMSMGAMPLPLTAPDEDDDFGADSNDSPDSPDSTDSPDSDIELEGEADSPDDDREATPDESKETEAARAEGKKKRSRRSRGRRKNGRAATSETSSEEEEDDLFHDEPDEAPAPAPQAAPGPRRVSPAPAPPSQHRERSGERAGERSSRSSGESYVIPASELEGGAREIIISVPDRHRSMADERKIAMFCDLENIALGVRDSEISKFDINLVLERLLEKGKIIVKKAYADWERYSDYKRPFHEAAIELIDIPQKFYSGKNSADIKMVVDAMDLSYSKEHLDTFVLLSGDSDFSPLVSKLKENNKYVIGIGVKNSSSALLIDNCDEFIYYEDVWRDTQQGPKLDGLNKKTAEAFSLMIDSIQALIRENKDVLWGSMIKQTMQRKKPSFNEGYYGYSTFSELLEDAERKNILKLKKDQRSGTYIVTGFAKSDTGGSGGSSRR